MQHLEAGAFEELRTRLLRDETELKGARSAFDRIASAAIGERARESRMAKLRPSGWATKTMCR